MRLSLKSAQTSYPVSLEEVKNFLRIDTLDDDCASSTSDDEMLTELIKAATEYCERYQKIAYLTQTWVLFCDTLPQEITLPKKNLQSIDEVSYKKLDGTTVDYTDYASNLTTGRMYFNEVIADELYPIDAIKIEFTCGYESKDQVPARTLQAIKLLISHWFENRTPLDETRTEPKEIAFTLSALLNMDKRVML
jgi:uncharacterized phiE125 gp8 family phage protein